MTDHLTNARACLSRVDQAATHFSAVSWLTATCEHILDHLEAQQAPPQPATAPPVAQQGDSGHRDGGEAARPNLNAQTAPSIPTDLTASQPEPGYGDGGEAVQAVAHVLHPEMFRPNYQPFVVFAETRTMGELIAADRARAETKARAAIAAAEPHIRAEIADEIERHYLGADFGRNPTTGADSPDASLHDAYDEALNLAARIARQEQP